MKSFEYQILRFLPNRVSGEFLNVGVVLHSKNDRFLACRMIDRVGRLSAFSPETNNRGLLKTLRFISREIDKLSYSARTELELNGTPELKDITRKVLPKDDSALVFSSVKKGIDPMLEKALNDIYYLFTKSTEKEESEQITEDKEVWRKIYKEHFDQYEVTKNLTSHLVRTKTDRIQFDKAWKNGSWHCFESLSFNLKRTDSIKSKVYKWMGKIQELNTSEESINLYLLTNFPHNHDRAELKQFIKLHLGEAQIKNSEVRLVDERAARAFAKELSEKMQQAD